VDAAALPPARDAFVPELRRTLRRAHILGLVPCLVHLDDVTFAELPARTVAADILRAHPGPLAIIVAPGTPPPVSPGHVPIELPVLGETERGIAWRRAADDAGVVLEDIDTLAARYRVGAALIRRAVTAARTQPVEEYIRQARDARLTQFARRVERLGTWSN